MRPWKHGLTGSATESVVASSAVIRFMMLSATKDIWNEKGFLRLCLPDDIISLAWFSLGSVPVRGESLETPMGICCISVWWTLDFSIMMTCSFSHAISAVCDAGGLLPKWSRILLVVCLGMVLLWRGVSTNPATGRMLLSELIVRNLILSVRTDPSLCAVSTGPGSRRNVHGLL